MDGFLLLWLTAAVAAGIGGNDAEPDDSLVMNWTNQLLPVIPSSSNSSSVSKLLVGGNRISLDQEDRLALAGYSDLLELHLDGNNVTRIPAEFFSVLPKLSVLSLSRNNISSLDPRSFSGLDVLTKLDLSHNLLTGLHTGLFRRLKNLKVLNLQGNPWNCSCRLLNTIRELRAAGVIGGNVTCASPEEQAGRLLLQETAVCHPSAPHTSTTDPQKPATPVTAKPSAGSSAGTSSPKHNISRGQTPALGNSWKFTACVAALAMFTSMLIVCGIKGPSWYKLIHDYRHRRLHQEEEEEEEEEEDSVSTVFSETGRYQTFTFRHGNGQTEEEEEEEEEEEDGYFEDPYIKREE